MYLYVWQIVGGQVQVFGCFFGDDQWVFVYFQVGQFGDQIFCVGCFDIEGFYDGQMVLMVQFGQDCVYGGMVLFVIDFLFEVVWFGCEGDIVVDEDWSCQCVMMCVVVFLFF